MNKNTKLLLICLISWSIYLLMNSEFMEAVYRYTASGEATRRKFEGFLLISIVRWMALVFAVISSLFLGKLFIKKLQ